MEAVIRNVRLFQRLRGVLKAFSIKLRFFLSDVRLFQRIRGFFKLFTKKIEVFNVGRFDRF
jgi:hypothetical protein